MNYDDVYDELKKDFENDKSKNKVNLSTYIILFFILLIPLLVFIFTRKPYSFVSSFDNLPEPIVTPISGGTMMTVLGKNLNIEFIATYDINGKVIAVKDFEAIADFSNKISPKDFVLGWGFMGKQENIDKFIWNDNLNNLFVSAYVKSENREWFDEIGGDTIFKKSYSNNRLIPCDKKTRMLLNKIGEGDEVKIKGYLAYLYMDDNSWKWGPSCLSANDVGCQVIYVTDVTWLREI